MASAHDLSLEIDEFISGEGGEFNDLFTRTYNYQSNANPTLKSLRSLQGRENIESWEDAVPTPVRLYKSHDLRSFEGTPDYVWESSGTTSDRVSKTPLKNPRLYQSTIYQSLKHIPYNHEATLLILMPDSLDWPKSSLSYMYSELRFWMRPKASINPIHLTDPVGTYKLAYSTIVKILKESVEEEYPVEILTTSYAAVNLMDYLKGNNLSFKLPLGSFMIDTGGYKNRSRSVSREEFVQLAEETLGIPCYSEYGMSEMSSQFWYEPESGLYHVPPWVRVKVLDPMTLEEDPDGVVVIYDLANLWSSCVLQTEDLGRVHGDGRYFEPLGRAEGAVAKGCSLAAERAMGS